MIQFMEQSDEASDPEEELLAERSDLDVSSIDFTLGYSVSPTWDSANDSFVLPNDKELAERKDCGGDTKRSSCDEDDEDVSEVMSVSNSELAGGESIHAPLPDDVPRPISSRGHASTSSYASLSAVKESLEPASLGRVL